MTKIKQLTEVKLTRLFLFMHGNLKKMYKITQDQKMHTT